jgi:hypothetical protein
MKLLAEILHTANTAAEVKKKKKSFFKSIFRSAKRFYLTATDSPHQEENSWKKEAPNYQKITRNIQEKWTTRRASFFTLEILKMLWVP